MENFVFILLTMGILLSVGQACLSPEGGRLSQATAPAGPAAGEGPPKAVK